MWPVSYDQPRHPSRPQYRYQAGYSSRLASRKTVLSQSLRRSHFNAVLSLSCLARHATKIESSKLLCKIRKPCLGTWLQTRSLMHTITRLEKVATAIVRDGSSRQRLRSSNIILFTDLTNVSCPTNSNMSFRLADLTGYNIKLAISTTIFRQADGCYSPATNSCILACFIHLLHNSRMLAVPDELLWDSSPKGE
jgi:hypothetical protein